MARFTLNFPDEDYLQLQEWATDAAGTLGRPRVSVQDLMRAMVRATVADNAAVTKAVIRELKRWPAEVAPR